MNGIKLAHVTMAKHITAALKGNKSTEDLIAEYMKLDKKVLAAMLAERTKLTTVTVESVCKLIMEDENCAWLTWGEIADAVAKAMNSATTVKCISSYASKNVKNKGWVLPQRKTQAERQAEYLKLAM